MNKLTIYLGDLVHNSVVKGPFTIPLNIGYVAAYAKKYFNKDINIKLFKYPLQMIDAIKEICPDILALGNYAWNADLNYKIIEFAKSCSKNLTAVLGGPDFPITEDERQEYLKERSLIDFYVTNQGEPGFLNLVERILGNSGNREKIKDVPTNGCVFLSRERDRLIVGKDVGETFESLDDIPSPYLSGILDEFFNDNLIPLIETDRGCPYACTYCAWRKNRKVRPFDLARVKAEVDYIAEHVKYTDLLIVTNANFGIFERDREIAKYIKRKSTKSGYPRKLDVAWAKNTPKRIIDIAETLGDLVEVTMSFQSLDKEVLKNIKRHNNTIDDFMEVRNHLARKGITSISEAILGLPGETRESHLNTLRTLFDIGAGNIVCYNLRALNGSLLNTRHQRQKYGIETKYRLYDIGFGKYDGIVSIEADEIVRSTNTLPEEDILFFRSLHWLVQFLWSYKYYLCLLKYLQSEGIHPVDFMLQIILDRKNAPFKVRELLSDFEKEARGEWFETSEDLFNYYSKEGNFKKIMGGEFGKLNYKYTFRVLCETKNEFGRYLGGIAKKIISQKFNNEKAEKSGRIIDNLIRYVQFRCIDFDKNLDFDREKKAEFDYDIAKWEEDDYANALQDYYETKGLSYMFYMPGEQYAALINNIRNFRHEDRNVTLRKMSEYVKKTDLFYRIARVSMVT